MKDDDARDLAPVNATDQAMASSTENDTSDTEKPVAAPPSDDEYPQGLKLVVLSSATIIAVFLIALDQVGTSPRLTLHQILAPPPFQLSPFMVWSLTQKPSRP